VSSGDLKGQTGKIIQVNGPQATIKLDNKLITFDVELDINQIQKNFKTGDQVTVVSGRN